MTMTATTRIYKKDNWDPFIDNARMVGFNLVGLLLEMTCENNLLFAERFR